MRELHLFAGVGGGILGGLLLGHLPVGAVELDPYCRRVLQERQTDGFLPAFPIHDDIRSFDARPWRGRVDVVCGGFPCQPWSSAGKQRGTDDPRHLWPEMARVVAECRPSLVFAENVSLAAFEEPWRDLRGLGYRVPPALCLAAADCGAPHLRKRWWLLASNADGDQLRAQQRRFKSRRASEAKLTDDGKKGPVANSDSHGEHAVAVDAKVARPQEPDRDANCPRLEVRKGKCRNARQELAAIVGADWWSTEPDVGRVADGVPARVDRLRGLGNAQVPICAAEAFTCLMEQMQ